MKQRRDYLLYIVLSTVLFILVNQIIWLNNMYNSYQQEMFYGLNDCLDKAVHMELTERMNAMKAPKIVRFAPSDPIMRGENEIVKQTIQTEDTTLVIEVNKNDPNIEFQILQFFFKKEHPIDIDRVNHYFKSRLKKRGYEYRDTYIDYYDLTSKKIIGKSNSEKIRSYSAISTDTVALDVIKSIGVKAYVVSSPRSIMKKMLFQIIFSVILIFFASFCLVFLLRIILRQRKFEKMRQDFVNTMVHEFKRPIASASTMIELMPYYLKKNDKEKVDEYLAGSLLEFKKLTAYTDRIQRISNNESDRIILEKVSVPLIQFFEKLRTTYSGSTQKTVNVKLLLETKQETLFIDLLHFSNVMDNLMENAVKYSGDIVNITLTVKDRAGNFEISVMDDGFGISDRDKKYIFDKFYRVDSKLVRNTVGFGLGLTYVKTIVESHGGNIHMSNAPINGSLFVINLPV